MFNRRVSRKQGTAPDKFWRMKRKRARSATSNSGVVKTVENVLSETVHSCRDPDFVQIFVNESDMLDRERKTFRLIRTTSDIIKIGKEALNLLEASKGMHLLHLTAPLKVFGALNGDARLLLEMFVKYGPCSHRVGDVNMIQYLFGGNFIGNRKGTNSLELLILLLCLKLRYHPRVHLLRGRNEIESSNLDTLREDTILRLGKDLGTSSWFESSVTYTKCILEHTQVRRFLRNV